jgi:hypothetical protein
MCTFRILNCRNDTFCCNLLKQHIWLCVMSPAVVKASRNVCIMLARSPPPPTSQWYEAMVDGGGMKWVLEMFNGRLWHILLHWSVMSKNCRFYKYWNTRSKRIIIKWKQYLCRPSKWIVKCSACTCWLSGRRLREQYTVEDNISMYPDNQDCDLWSHKH